jgi:cytochrome c-type biogenesis protein CcmH
VIGRVRCIIAASCLVALLALTASPIVPAAPAPRANLPDIEDEVMCTICGTLLAESDSPQANGERALIRRLIAEGETKQQIKDALVAQYGRNVLATPSTHGFDLVAWVAPALGLLVGTAVIVVTMRRRTRTRQDDDDPPIELDAADAARLERDLSSYD